MHDSGNELTTSLGPALTQASISNLHTPNSAAQCNQLREPTPPLNISLYVTRHVTFRLLQNDIFMLFRSSYTIEKTKPPIAKKRGTLGYPFLLYCCYPSCLVYTFALPHNVRPTSNDIYTPVM